MKTKFLILVIFLTAFSFKEQYFVGTISYNFNYLDNKGNNLNGKFDYKKSIYRFSSFSYEGLTIGKDNLTYYYYSKTNKCFYVKSGMPDSSCFDYGLDNSTSKIYTKNESKKIKGQDCIIVYQESKNSKSVHY